MERRLDQRGLAKRLLPTDDPRLRTLARKRPARVVLDLVRAYALILLSFWLLTTSPPWWLMLACFLVIGTQQYALFIMGHDGMHANLARRRVVNDRLSTGLLLAPLGTRVRSAREGHLSHHRNLGSDADPDRGLHIMSNKNTVGRFSLFLTGLATVPAVLMRLLPIGNDAPEQKEVTVAASRFDAIRSRWPVLVAQAIVFALISSTLPWWYYLAFWVLPVYLLVFLTDELRAFCEHAQPMLSDEEGDSHRLVTFVPNVVERVLFAPCNMNYHAEHHLWPFIPYYNLPRAHQITRGCDEIEVRHSYVGFICEHYRRLLSAPSGRHGAAE